MAFDHLRSAALPADEFLLGAQQVRALPVEIPDLVEQGEFYVGVETQVADEFTDMSPVLLFNMGAVRVITG